MCGRFGVLYDVPHIITTILRNMCVLVASGM